MCQSPASGRRGVVSAKAGRARGEGGGAVEVKVKAGEVGGPKAARARRLREWGGSESAG